MTELSDKLAADIREAAGEIPFGEQMLERIIDVDAERSALGNTIANLEAAGREGHNQFVADTANMIQLLRQAYERYAEYQRYLISLEYHRRVQEGEDVTPFGDIGETLRGANDDAK